MTISNIRKYLQDYIRFADDNKIKELFSLIESKTINEDKIWSNIEFIKEMESRSFDLKSEQTKGIAYSEIKKNTRKKIKK